MNFQKRFKIIIFTIKPQYIDVSLKFLDLYMWSSFQYWYNWFFFDRFKIEIDTIQMQYIDVSLMFSDLYMWSFCFLVFNTDINDMIINGNILQIWNNCSIKTKFWYTLHITRTLNEIYWLGVAADLGKKGLSS